MAEDKVEAFDKDAWGKEMDPQDHLSTWDGFMALTKWGTIGVIVLLILMAIFLL